MSFVLPRLGAGDESAALQRARSQPDPASIATWMPVRVEGVTWPATGARRITETQLSGLRERLLEVATVAGYPGGPSSTSFDAPAVKVLREALPITAHEASHRAAWAFLNCCWMLDISVWRWGGATGDHFTGNPNRDTFRRLWWRGHVFGDDFDLGRLQEDELVGLTERPHLPPPLVRVVAREFLALVEGRSDLRRMFLMRETAKRLLRRTPIIDFLALGDAELRHEARQALSGSLLSLGFDPLPLSPAPVPTLVPNDETAVTVLPTRTVALPSQDPLVLSGDERHALTIARRAGRVTTADLRPSVGPQALDLLTGLVRKGHLERRGQTRGTHYVIPSSNTSPTSSKGSGGLTERAGTSTTPAAIDIEPALAPLDHVPGPQSTTRSGALGQPLVPDPGQPAHREAPPGATPPPDPGSRTLAEMTAAGIVPAGSVLVCGIGGRYRRVTVLEGGLVRPYTAGTGVLPLGEYTAQFTQRPALHIWSLEKAGKLVPLSVLKQAQVPATIRERVAQHRDQEARRRGGSRAGQEQHWDARLAATTQILLETAEKCLLTDHSSLALAVSARSSTPMLDVSAPQDALLLQELLADASRAHLTACGALLCALVKTPGRNEPGEEFWQVADSLALFTPRRGRPTRESFWVSQVARLHVHFGYRML